MIISFDSFMLYCIFGGLAIGAFTLWGTWEFLYTKREQLYEDKRKLYTALTVVIVVTVSILTFKHNTLDYLRPGISQMRDRFELYPDDWVKDENTESLINIKDSLILTYNSRHHKFTHITKIGKPTVSMIYSEGRSFYLVWEGICQDRTENIYQEFLGIKKEELIK